MVGSGVAEGKWRRKKEKKERERLSSNAQYACGPPFVYAYVYVVRVPCVYGRLASWW